MKKKIFITILIIFILLMCSMIGVWIIVHPKDATITLAEDNSINENTIDISTNTIPNKVEPESNIIIAESELKTESKVKIEPDKESPKQDDIVVDKTSNKKSSTTITSTTSANKNTQTNKNNNASNAQNNENTNTKSTTSTLNVENTKPKEDTTTKPIEKTTETKPVTQPTRCTNNNNHGMDIGNSGEWFNSKNEAIEHYKQIIQYWGNLWESHKIEDSEYYKNCPIGYEIWNCMYCSKWTINFYYR